jgi:demethylmenaquinone methyltransferase/2-methoxy-6-polyprenyl-1,4-benzoquinol methylase
MSEEALRTYYADRADTYDDIYEIPEVQADYNRLESVFRERFAGRDVLEIACGTGYWTRVIADVADSILGVDANREPIREARTRTYPQSTPVRFVLGDAYRLPVTGGFSAGFAGFWWSHVPRQRRTGFLRAFHAALEPGAVVCLFDNRLVEGFVEPDTTDERGNTYQFRDDAGDGEYRVLKNFPAEDELTGLVSNYGSDVEYREFEHFWCLSYRV